ncbi:MAG: serine/threonine protein kinase [Moorea sp. SIO3I7]|uniref:serine/threonine protein kinase n=1 Tax=Moorena sp. SIO3I8 TaxID=2607833 RepID=UPI0013C253DD|nr:serine/threonine-protein kinase [Moorena sp. SIO3I8]NEN94875.1 serine/threonine protein kinase [Moorena sp. SIO3I7]NEO06871.1 serine/threonine protein kinase [Moorena sp. SIO3I8]
MTSLEPGDSLKDGDYTIQGELGTGGFGTTYQATRHLPDGQEEIVAIKIGKDQLNDNEQTNREEKFQDEAQRLNQFNHNHIVKFIEYFYDNTINRPCLVMEYIEGETLQKLTKPGNGIPEEQAIKYIRQVANALEAMHEVNLIHRDVNHRNIMVRHGTEEAVLIDFGIAREFVPDRTIELTQQWSEYYAPPEQQLRRFRAGPRVDIYALSATLYFLLTGGQPVSSRERITEFIKSRKDPQKQDIKKFVNNKNLRIVILKGMQFNPYKRPKSISDWLKLLEPPIPIITDRLKRIIGAISGIAILHAIVIGLIIIPDTHRHRPIITKNEWTELEFKGLSAINQFNQNGDAEKLKQALDLFDKNKNNYQGNKEFEELFSELTRRYAQDVLARSGDPGVRKGIEKLEEIQQRLVQNFDIENLPEDDIIAQEYKDVSALLEKMRKSRNGNN